MPGNPRAIIGEAEQRFPVRIVIRWHRHPLHPDDRLARRELRVRGWSRSGRNPRRWGSSPQPASPADRIPMINRTDERAMEQLLPAYKAVGERRYRGTSAGSLRRRLRSENRSFRPDLAHRGRAENISEDQAVDGAGGHGNRFRYVPVKARSQRPTWPSNFIRSLTWMVSSERTTALISRPRLGSAPFPLPVASARSGADQVLLPRMLLREISPIS